MIGDGRIRSLERAARGGDLSSAYQAITEITRHGGERSAIEFGLEVTAGSISKHPPLERALMAIAPGLVEATEPTNLERASDEDLRLVAELHHRLFGDAAPELRQLADLVRYANVTREIGRRLPVLPVMVRVWQEPSEDRRRLRAGETERFWINNHRDYPLDEAERVVRELGGRVAPRSRAWGDKHRSPVVVFSGVRPRDVDRALSFLPGMCMARQKTWGGDALPELRQPPTLLLLFPTEFAAPPDDCDSIFWQQVRGAWSLSDPGPADPIAIVRDTRPATPDQAAPAISAYQADTGRRLRLYTRMQSEFRRLRQQQANRLR